MDCYLAESLLICCYKMISPEQSVRMNGDAEVWQVVVVMGAVVLVLMLLALNGGGGESLLG